MTAMIIWVYLTAVIPRLRFKSATFYVHVNSFYTFELERHTCCFNCSNV